MADITGEYRTEVWEDEWQFGICQLKDRCKIMKDAKACALTFLKRIDRFVVGFAYEDYYEDLNRKIRVFKFFGPVLESELNNG